MNLVAAEIHPMGERKIALTFRDNKGARKIGTLRENIYSVMAWEDKHALPKLVESRVLTDEQVKQLWQAHWELVRHYLAINEETSTVACQHYYLKEQKYAN